MTDVEELLRATLTDPRRQVEPVPGMYETVRGRARDRRHRRLAIAAVSAAVVVVAVCSVIGVRSAGQHRVAPVNLPSPSGNPFEGTVGQSIDLGTNSLGIVDAVTTTDALYVLGSDPSKVMALDLSGTRVSKTADGPTGTPSGIVVADGLVWAWSQNTGDLRAYDANTLIQFADFNTNLQIFNAVAVDGDIYLATDTGLFRSTNKASGKDVLTAPTKLAAPGLDGSIYGLAADPARHRVLVGVTPPGTAPANGFAGARVVAVDTRTGKVAQQGEQTSVGKESIAVIDGQVWIGGYGDVDKPRLMHLDARTLQVIGSSPASADLGPGTILWPGSQVLWVRSGGSQQLACIDPSSGAILEQWANVQGPVTSVSGHAFGVQYGLQPLTLGGGCAG